jgi:carboxymethylenebutenolidase
MREFQVDGETIRAYLAVPETGSGPGVLVLHAWWGLTQPFRQICDRLALAGFVALAPDLYHGKTATTVEEAKALAAALNQDEERVRSDIAGAVQVLRQHHANKLANGRGKLALVGRRLRVRHVRQNVRGDRRSRDLLCHLPRTGLWPCESCLSLPLRGG